VILSAAKNLLFPLIYKQILRCAQDDITCSIPLNNPMVDVKSVSILSMAVAGSLTREIGVETLIPPAARLLPGVWVISSCGPHGGVRRAPGLAKCGLAASPLLRP
ncbi:MAG: hypothetical protein ACRD2P_18490, partial [Terriglobia bacterium]